MYIHWKRQVNWKAFALDVVSEIARHSGGRESDQWFLENRRISKWTHWGLGDHLMGLLFVCLFLFRQFEALMQFC